ncbi:GIN domain-containing protein [Maribacter chungangensis]|uniref:GIN domain-containing protein n=1 Tax=Maribacter chungangensis TaxID=1069117 RepID=A0ABW3B724_9FLAO
MYPILNSNYNATLVIYYNNECEHYQSPQYDIYLNHTGILGVTLAGIVDLQSEDVIRQKELRIQGDGILNGDLEVFVDTLSVDLKGISTMYFSGTANTANLKIAGIGMICARSLKTKSGKSVSDGIAIISD